MTPKGSQGRGTPRTQAARKQERPPRPARASRIRMGAWRVLPPLRTVVPPGRLDSCQTWFVLPAWPPAAQPVPASGHRWPVLPPRHYCTTATLASATCCAACPMRRFPLARRARTPSCAGHGIGSRERCGRHGHWPRDPWAHREKSLSWGRSAASGAGLLGCSEASCRRCGTCTQRGHPGAA